jgi:chemotaxis protein MotB
MGHTGQKPFFLAGNGSGVIMDQNNPEERPVKKPAPRPLAATRYQKMILASQESVDADHNWLITLSDVMSLLLVFFIIFFAISQASVNRKEAQGKKVSASIQAPAPPRAELRNETLEKIQKDMKAMVAGLNLDDQVSVQTLDREIIITMKEKVTFKTGEADILKASEPMLDTIARTVKKYPAFLVDIDGHTDDQPIKTSRFPSNWELSVARATSVLKYLITTHALDPARFTIKGNADQRPLIPNWTPEQRAQNRRVEIRLKEGHPTKA